MIKQPSGVPVAVTKKGDTYEISFSLHSGYSWVSVHPSEEWAQRAVKEAAAIAKIIRAATALAKPSYGREQYNMKMELLNDAIKALGKEGIEL